MRSLHAEALELMKASAGNVTKDAQTKLIGAAHVHATLYVGEQLERIADMLQSGFKVNRQGDTFGDESRYIEPQAPQ